MTGLRGVLLDIEGTTSSIRFVYDVMFPYVRDNLSGYLETAWQSPALLNSLELLAVDLGFADRQAWLGKTTPTEGQQQVVRGVLQLMDGDVKATGLKQLQGQIWESGFRSGCLVAELYDDVAPAIRSWHRAGIDVRIYSSGSIAAQQLFFGHTVAGNLLDLLKGHYDTTTGPKQHPESYRKIASDIGIAADQILFISDVVEELEAARTAGMRCLLSLRPGNHPVDANHPFDTVTDFRKIEISSKSQ